MTRRPSSISSSSWTTWPLIDSPPRDSSIVRGIAFRQRPSRSPRQSIDSSGPSIARWTIVGSSHVVDEEARLRGVTREVDRARARAAARLDHHRVVERVEVVARAARSAARAARAASAAGAPRTCRRSRGRPRQRARARAAASSSARARDLDVEVGQRQHRADAVLARTAPRAPGRSRGRRSAERPRARAPRTAPAPAARGRRRPSSSAPRSTTTMS